MSRFYKIPEFRLDAVKYGHLGSLVDSLLSEPLTVVFGPIDGYHILKKSVDSRRGRPEIIYSLIVESGRELAAEILTQTEAQELLSEATLDIEPVSHPERPVIVGAGPAGLFAALVLAAAGARPLVLETGRDVDSRSADIANFIANRAFSESSNYLSGEGGAGTFSDGKLYTRGRDRRSGWVLKQLVDAGAGQETLYLKRPHLGSDKLPGIVKNLRQKIIALGGEFRFDCRVDDMIIRNSVCTGVRLASGETIEARAAIVATGLGGRTLARKLLGRVKYELKGFQLGSRIEHPQRLIDRRQYRVERPPTLGAAEYSMAMSPTEERPGVSTFCMCPGGQVIPAAAFAGELSSNGMSNSLRDGEFANSTLVVTPRKLNFKDGYEAFDFLSELGRRVFAAGGGDYAFPAQDATGFLRGTPTITRSRTSAPFGLRPCDVASLLPDEAAGSIREALRLFDRKFPGFIAEGKFIGVESYVSSPVRFVRGPDGMSSTAGLFTCGEGAGAAGGIMSAAVDGIETAQKVIIFLNKNHGRSS